MLQSVLRHSSAYELSRRLIGARREMQTLVDDYIRPSPGLRVLDIGCGNGRLVEFLPHDVGYVGIDHNESYISAAIDRFGAPNVRFVCGDLADVSFDEVGLFDVAVSIGVLHHLDDATARRALTAAVSHLDLDGRLITMDPCFDPTQPQIARVLMALDRGKYVRHPANYGQLIEPLVGQLSAAVRHDVYRFPYSHFITESMVLGTNTVDPHLA